MIDFQKMILLFIKDGLWAWEETIGHQSHTLHCVPTTLITQTRQHSLGRCSTNVIQLSTFHEGMKEQILILKLIKHYGMLTNSTGIAWRQLIETRSQWCLSHSSSFHVRSSWISVEKSTGDGESPFKSMALDEKYFIGDCWKTGAIHCRYCAWLPQTVTKQYTF